MIFEIIRFLLDVASGLLCGAFLLRLYMQYQRTPFRNPIGRFVFALTDWAVLPLRKVLPAIGRLDTSSLVAAYLVQLLRFALLWLMAGWGPGAGVLPIVAFFALLKLALTALMVLVIINAILSWVRADSPIVDVIERLCAPLLRPFRRMIPLVGGIDLSPLALIVVLQILAIVLDGLQNAVLR
jgi:YggT family protein